MKKLFALLTAVALVVVGSAFSIGVAGAHTTAHAANAKAHAAASRGPRGPRGPRGFRGFRGPRGFTGAQGAAGPAGPAGATGATGATGAAGAGATPIAKLVTGNNTVYTVTINGVTIGEVNNSTGTCGTGVELVNTIAGIPLELSVDGNNYNAVAGPTTTGAPLPTPTGIGGVGSSDFFTSAFTNGVAGPTGIAGDVSVTAASGFASTSGCLVTGALS